MLNRILLIVDAFLVVALVLLALRFHAVWTAPADLAAARPGAAEPGDDAAPTASPLSPSAGLPLSAFSAIATKNLFNPLRTEEAPPPSPAMTPQRPPAPVSPRPRLYGVVLGTEGGARAFLDDPRTRKVAGYTVGDSVGDSRLDEIKPDRVVLRRGSEVFEVLLRDPSKPRPVAAPAPALPGAPGTGAVGAGMPGSGTPGRPAVGSGVPGTPPGGPGVGSGVPGTPSGGPEIPASPGFLPIGPGALPSGGSLAPDPPGMPVDPGIPPTS